MVWPFHRKLRQQMKEVEAEFPTPKEPRFTRRQAKRMLNETADMMDSFKTAMRHARKLSSIHKRFIKQGTKKNLWNIRTHELWKNQIFKMEAQMSEEWYKMTEAVEKAQAYGVELVSTVEAEKKYEQERSGSESGLAGLDPDVKAKILRQEIDKLEHKEAEVLRKEHEENERWWRETAKEAKEEQLKRTG